MSKIIGPIIYQKECHFADQPYCIILDEGQA